MLPMLDKDRIIMLYNTYSSVYMPCVYIDTRKIYLKCQSCLTPPGIQAAGTFWQDNSYDDCENPQE